MACAARWRKRSPVSASTEFIVTGLPIRQQTFEKLVIAARWPAEFFTLYIDNDYARFDPIHRRCIHSHAPFVWRAESYTSNIDLPARDKPAIHLMALYAFERMRSLRGRHSDEKPPLTVREREVLAWAADGKSALDIGQILNISKRTVDEHSQTAARKLGAANRTQAVAIALRDRIIEV